jgi:hypothetical protein
MARSMFSDRVDEVFGDLALVMEAEHARGNGPMFNFREMESRGDPSSASFRFPLDRAAIEAEFSFAPHIGFNGDNAIVDWDRGVALGGGNGKPNFLDRAVHRRWWRRWNDNPRPRRMVGTPIDESQQPLVTSRDEAERKLARHLRAPWVHVSENVLEPLFLPQGVDEYFQVASDTDGVWRTGIHHNGELVDVRAHAGLNDAVEWLIDYWRRNGIIDPDPGAGHG